MENHGKNILNYIPQREPFVMVDKIIYSDDKFTSTAFLIKQDNIFVEDGFFKEPGLIENIAQTAASNAGYVAIKENRPVLLGFIAAIKNLQINYFPKVGDELITEIIIENQIFDITIIQGRAICDKKIVAQCELKIFIKK
ncbi:MAG: 3-hydroxyacyl-ACP dehydratase [Bacteroidetes bacterium]|nr:3-hydroxyacyl-ACP dehydratase [Bacteroidota bacterium]